MRDEIRDGQQVVSANARGHERLVRVAERRVRDQQRLLRFRPLREFFGTELVEKLARARRRLARNVRGQRSGANRLRPGFVRDFGISVHDHFAEVAQKLGRAILQRRELE